MVCLCRRSDTPHLEACNTCEPLVAQILCDQIPLTHSRYRNDFNSGRVHSISIYLSVCLHDAETTFRSHTSNFGIGSFRFSKGSLRIENRKSCSLGRLAHEYLI